MNRIVKGTTYVCTSVDELLSSVDEPLGVARARRLEFFDGSITASTPSL